MINIVMYCNNDPHSLLTGFYTAMLLPAAIMCLVCVIYGAAKLSSCIPVLVLHVDISGLFLYVVRKVVIVKKFLLLQISMDCKRKEPNES